MSKVDLAQFHKAFYEESLDGLDAMEQALLALDEGADDPELINVVFRAAHSIKGGAATFGFTEVAAFTHVAENLMDEVRSGRRPMEKAVVELLLRSGDTVRDMLSLSMAGQPAATASAPANPCVIRWHNGEDAEKKPGCTAALSDPQPQITVPIPPGVAAPSR